MTPQIKARYDAEDSSPTVCRCEGSPRPLEATGTHCSQCRRMFSAGVRMAFARRERRARMFSFPTFTRWLQGAATMLRPRRLQH